MPIKYIYKTRKRWKDFTPVPSLRPTLFAPAKNFRNSLTHSQWTYPCLPFCTLSRLIRPDRNLRKKLLRKEWVKRKKSIGGQKTRGRCLIFFFDAYIIQRETYVLYFCPFFCYDLLIFYYISLSFSFCLSLFFYLNRINTKLHFHINARFYKIYICPYE